MRVSLPACVAMSQLGAQVGMRECTYFVGNHLINPAPARCRLVSFVSSLPSRCLLRPCLPWSLTRACHFWAVPGRSQCGNGRSSDNIGSAATQSGKNGEGNRKYVTRNHIEDTAERRAKSPSKRHPQPPKKRPSPKVHPSHPHRRSPKQAAVELDSVTDVKTEEPKQRKEKKRKVKSKRDLLSFRFL